LVLDVRSFRAYARGHLPTAVNLPLWDYHWADTTPAGIGAFTRQMQRILEFVGVSARRNVVFYENISGMSAARGVWLLHYLGHDRARLLDGGLKRWRALGYPVSKDPIPPHPTSWAVQPRESVLATADYVRGHLLSPHVAFLDTRSPGEFRGVQIRAARGGALPGARNVNWSRAVARDGRFKKPPELAALYRRAGLTPEREVVTYCQGAYRAAHGYVALKLLGYPKVRTYLGSWFEWGNLPDAPIATPFRSR
jgi:thiosulfate/3-mercaptopyruvate sulfurtransferase